MPIQNQISLDIPAPDAEKIRAALNVIDTLLKPRLVQLDSPLRMQLPKMGDRTVGFVTKSLEFAETNPQLQPRYLDVAEAKKDLAGVSLLREFAVTLEKVAEMVNDTMTVCGSEAYTAALSFYSAVKGAARDRQPGAQIIYDDLRARFPRVGPKSQEESAS